MARKPNILLVDDYEVNLDLLEAYLELSGIPMELYKARNGAEAYAIIEQYTLDLILLDVMLPDTSGYDICRWVKEHKLYQNIPVIMITALNDKQDMLKGLQSGADEFLTKPVDSHELVLRVKNLLKMKSIANDLDDKYMQLHRELMIATELQKSLLPHKVPQYENVHIDVLYKPSSFIGGDFYDFYKLNDTTVAFLAADVSGKGIPAAMFMMTAKTIIKDLAESGMAVNDIFTKANEKLCENNESGMFVTAWMGKVDLLTGKLSFANAGHNPPVVVHVNGECEYLKSRTGFVLAGMEGMKYRANEMTLCKGDRILIYTDGSGVLSLNDVKVPFSPGTIVIIPPNNA